MDDGTERSRQCRVIAPLEGHTIAVTGDRRTDELATHLEALGAATVIGPVLRTRTDGDLLGRLAAVTGGVIADPPEYLVATTAVGLRSWLDAAAAWGLRSQLVDALQTTKILARGPKVVGALHTADLPIWLPDRTGRTDRLLRALSARRPLGARVAVQTPGGDHGDTVRRVEQLGARVVAVDAYDLAWPDDLAPAGRLVRAVGERRVAAVTFTSRAAVRNFVELARVEGIVEHVVAALGADVLPMCVGPVTARALADEAGVIGAAPREPTLGALVASLSTELWRRHHRHLRTPGAVDLVVQGRVVAPGGPSVLMSDREAAMLRRLLASAGRVVSAEVLLQAVWPDEAVETAVIETTMARLRRRLRGTGVVIETVRRRGYALTSEVANCGTGPADSMANLSAPVPV